MVFTQKNIKESKPLVFRILVKHIASAIDENIDCNQEYRELYECAYGEKLTPEVLTEWVKNMAVTDGSDRSNGQKWTVDQCYEIGTKLNFDWNKHNKYEWYAVMNMEYSDRYNTAKRFGLQDDPVYFGSLAKDWLCDKDVDVSKKLYNYYFDVVV